MQLKMCESEVKAATPKLINGTAARTSFQESQSYLTLLVSEWRITIKFLITIRGKYPHKEKIHEDISY